MRESKRVLWCGILIVIVGGLFEWNAIRTAHLAQSEVGELRVKVAAIAERLNSAENARLHQDEADRRSQVTIGHLDEGIASMTGLAEKMKTLSANKAKEDEAQ